MASRFSIEAVVSMIDRVSGPMKNASNSVTGFSQKMQTHFSKAEKSSLGFGNVIKGVIGANIIQGLAYRITDTADRAIQLASDLTEVQNVVDTTFGKSSQAIDKWSQNAITQFGLSELQAKRFNGTMGAMLKSSGLSADSLVEMSTRLTGLAGDFASFYNLDAQAAFDKIRSGISGETEPLKQLGINMSVANLQAFALTQGITKQWKVMTQAEQVQLRYNYLLSVSKDAQGDFAKTLMTSYANQKRVLSTNFDQFLARIATQILPDLTTSLINANSVLDKIDGKKIGNTFKIAINILKIFVSTLWSLRYVIGSIISVYGVWKIGTIAIITYQRLLQISMWALRGAQLALMAIGWIQYLWLMRDVIGGAIIRTKLWAAAQWLFNLAMKNSIIQMTVMIIKTTALLVKQIAMATWTKIQTAVQWLFNAAMGQSVLISGLLIAKTWAIVGATKAWSAAQTVINALLTMNPIGLVILAIAALGYAIYDLYKNWDMYAARFNASILTWQAGFARVKLEVYDLLNSIGLLSNESLYQAKVNFLTTGTEAAKARTKVLDMTKEKRLQTEKSINPFENKTKILQTEKTNNNYSFASPESQKMASGTNINGRIGIDINSNAKDTTVKQKGVPSFVQTNLNAGLQF